MPQVPGEKKEKNKRSVKKKFLWFGYGSFEGSEVGLLGKRREFLVCKHIKGCYKVGDFGTDNGHGMKRRVLCGGGRDCR